MTAETSSSTSRPVLPDGVGVAEVAVPAPARDGGASRAPRWGAARVGASFALVAAAFAHCIAIGWMRWGDWLIDTGRELEWPRRILEGERLYADLYYSFFPLAPYANALLYRIFGVRAEVLAVAGIVSAGLMCVALWLLVRRLTGVAAATAVALAFTYACAFSHVAETGIFNFALPYAFAATYGIVAATWSLWFLVVHAERGGIAPLAASAALLALTAVAKLEPLLPILAAHAALTGARLLAPAGRAPRWRAVAAIYACALVAVAGVYCALALRDGPSPWGDNVGAAMNAGMAPFIRAMMGLDEPLWRLRALAVEWAFLGGALALAGGLATWASTRASAWSRGAAAALAGGCGLAAAFARGQDLVFSVALPVALAAVTFHAVALVRHAGCRRLHVRRLLLWTFVLGCLPRIALRPTVDGYGFFLLAPYLAAAAVLLLRDVPRTLQRSVSGRRVIALWGMGLLLGTAAVAWRASAMQYARLDVPLSSERGMLYVREPVAPEVVSYLRGLPAGARVLVIPQSTVLNFFSGRRGADHLFSYLPPDLVRPQDEATLIAHWTGTPPDLIVFAGIDLGDYSAGKFGIDYGRRCGAWLERRYRLLPGPFAARGISLAVPR